VSPADNDLALDGSARRSSRGSTDEWRIPAADSNKPAPAATCKTDFRTGRDLISTGGTKRRGSSHFSFSPGCWNGVRRPPLTRMVREDPAEPPSPPKSYPAEKAWGGDIISENDNLARSFSLRAAGSGLLGFLMVFCP
jgi:hypothetical protein